MDNLGRLVAVPTAIGSDFSQWLASLANLHALSGTFLVAPKAYILVLVASSWDRKGKVNVKTQIKATFWTVLTLCPGMVNDARSAKGMATVQLDLLDTGLTADLAET